jgi:hypothetical protein
MPDGVAENDAQEQRQRGVLVQNGCDLLHGGGPSDFRQSLANKKWPAMGPLLGGQLLCQGDSVICGFS